MTYRRAKDGQKIRLRRQKDNQCVFADRNNAIPTWRDSDGGSAQRPSFRAPRHRAIGEATYKERISVTETIRLLAHGGLARDGHVATFPKLADPMAEVLPRFPSGVAISRVRRGATEGMARKKNRLYAARRAEVLDALHWLKGAIPITRMLSRNPSGSPTSSAGRKSLALRIWGRRRESSQRTKAHRPTRPALRSKYLRRRLKLGECSSQNYRLATSGSKNVSRIFSFSKRGGRHARRVSMANHRPNHAPESRTLGFFCLAIAWLSPGGAGCFFHARPFGEGLTFGKWLERLAYY